jgi:uncharacterized protein YcfJ
MKTASIAIAALTSLCAWTNVLAFETIVKVISVTPAREIVNEPYQSCQPDYERAAPNAPAQQNCRETDHYDVKLMYTVVYEYQGQRFSAKLPYDPGAELKVNVSVTPK